MSATPAHDVLLSDRTTLRLGGPAGTFNTTESVDDLVAAVSGIDAEDGRLLVLGGGSNLVVADAGYPGTVLHVAIPGVSVEPAADTAAVRLRVGAGEEWGPLVARCVRDGLSGIECLAGIPGRVGATPIQNVGAYGQEVSESIVEVLAYDRVRAELRRLGNADCGFAYRSSAFKGHDRFVVCEVVFELTRSPWSRPLRYAEAARAMGAPLGGQVPLAEARETVLSLRKSKGMVIDPADPDTRSAGSFFTNPILTQDEFTDFAKRVAERLGPGIEPPAFPDAQGRLKTSAAWLIDRAGFPKGYGTGPARISSKHTLALTNPGGATTADLLDLAREVRGGVAEVFGVTLANEPVLVGVRL